MLTKIKTFFNKMTLTKKVIVIIGLLVLGLILFFFTKSSINDWLENRHNAAFAAAQTKADEERKVLEDKSAVQQLQIDILKKESENLRLQLTSKDSEIAESNQRLNDIAASKVRIQKVYINNTQSLQGLKTETELLVFLKTQLKDLGFNPE